MPRLISNARGKYDSINFDKTLFTFFPVEVYVRSSKLLPRAQK